MKFYLGAHHPDWIERAGVPLFVSRTTLWARKSLPRASCSWALDSGGFTELSVHGQWRASARVYAGEVQRFMGEIGSMDWAAPQDWMCEASVLKRTGLTVEEHQARTLRNYLELRELAPEVPWIPVLQGWTMGDYLRHADAYFDAGVQLDRLLTVGVGTVCRRQATMRAGHIVMLLAGEGLKLHAFGFKLTGLRESAKHLASADSMAWSVDARKSRPLPGHAHKSCANCMEYALYWREGVIDRNERYSTQ